jgi:predicted O-methyltransferase YrrM
MIRTRQSGDPMNRSLFGRLKKLVNTSEAKSARIPVELLNSLRSQLAHFEMGWPPGHFYSPIPNLSQVREREHEIFCVPVDLPGIDLRVDEQVRLAHELASFYPEQPFEDHQNSRTRYYFVNPNFSYGEALALYGMLRYLRPRKVIEIGCGYSSCITLDTSELFLGGSIECVFIEPDPTLLRSLLREEDIARVTIFSEKLQTVDKRIFESLHANDVLFIDSTHVSKVDSDVNHIMFDILPSLESGVYIHIHDIMFPFEYPKEWVYEGRAWNEAYIVRAFLQFNGEFEIVFFNSYLGQFRTDLFESIPLFLRNPGTSLWLRKR